MFALGAAEGLVLGLILGPVLELLGRILLEFLDLFLCLVVCVLLAHAPVRFRHRSDANVSAFRSSTTSSAVRPRTDACGLPRLTHTERRPASFAPAASQLLPDTSVTSSACTPNARGARAYTSGAGL